MQACVSLVTSPVVVFERDGGCITSDAPGMALHAGLECGIIGERCPGMDMVRYVLPC
jgi:hypothetical protein